MSTLLHEVFFLVYIVNTTSYKYKLEGSSKVADNTNDSEIKNGNIPPSFTTFTQNYPQNEE